jgi:hypothetical protein
VRRRFLVWLNKARRHPSAVLLIGQLLVVLAYPFLDTSTVGRAFIGVAQMVLVLTAVAAVRLTPVLSWFAILAGFPAMVFAILEAFFPSTGWVLLVSAGVHAPFYFYVSYAMILFHDDHVTTDELYATAAAFTVVAWAFAYVFSGVQVIWPNSFTGESSPVLPWFDLLFLSFTNLTSVGLSDVLPIDPHARSFVMIEQLAGVLYVALVIARLVALTVVRAKER